MNKTREIDSLYKILALYEEIENTESPVTLGGYLGYVDRMYVQWLGVGNSEIYDTLKGLWTLGLQAGHRRVKSMVFHMIEVVERGEANGA